MARVFRVATSRVAHHCHKGHEIPVGQGYAWAAPGYHARKKFACKDHPFRQSDLTSGLRSDALYAAEAFEDALDQIDTASSEALDELTTAKEEFQSAIEQYVSQREVALDAWENGNEQLQELLDTAESALDEIQSWEPEDWDGEEELRDADDHDEDEELQGRIEEARDSWVDHVEEQLDGARELTGLDF